MIVVAIVGVLTTIAVPTLVNYRNKATMALVISEIKMLEKEIKVYETENMRRPDDLSEIGLGIINDPWGNPYQYLRLPVDDDDGDDDDDETEKAKGKKDKKDKKEKGEKELKPRKDHWRVPVNTDFDLYSMGPDGKSKAPFTAKDSRDDIVRANDGQFIGLASEF
jgi:general secretion pathway protein G